MSRELLDAVLDGPYKLTPRPVPVAGDLRLAWGITVVLLILKNSRGKSASLQKMHFLAHCARTKETRLEALQVFSGERTSADLLIRVEPWLNRAIAFAKAEGLIDLKNGKTVKLTVHGIKILEAMLEETEFLVEEHAFLREMRDKASEAAIEKIMKMEFA